MKNVIVTGKQNFMNHPIPIVLGGFGPDKKCISDKTVAEIHGQPVYEIRRRINDNMKRFKEYVDFIDFSQRMGESQTLDLLKELGYAKQSITQAEHIYLLSERGYSKLIKIMDTDLAWEVHERLVDEYFSMRDKIIPALTEQHIALESRIQELEKQYNLLSNKIDLSIGLQIPLNITYSECLSDSNLNGISYKERAEKANEYTELIAKLGNYDNSTRVFGKIYKLMREKYGLVLDRWKTSFEDENPKKAGGSLWPTIMASPILYQIFISIAEEMIKQLETFGSSDEYVIAASFDEALTQMNVLAMDKYDANKLTAFKEVYKYMKNMLNVDWSSVKNKKAAVNSSPELQALFIKAVNCLQYSGAL